MDRGTRFKCSQRAHGDRAGYLRGVRRLPERRPIMMVLKVNGWPLREPFAGGPVAQCKHREQQRTHQQPINEFTCHARDEPKPNYIGKAAAGAARRNAVLMGPRLKRPLFLNVLNEPARDDAGNPRCPADHLRPGPPFKNMEVARSGPRWGRDDRQHGPLWRDRREVSYVFVKGVERVRGHREAGGESDAGRGWTPSGLDRGRPHEAFRRSFMEGCRQAYAGCEGAGIRWSQPFRGRADGGAR